MRHLPLVSQRGDDVGQESAFDGTRIVRRLPRCYNSISLLDAAIWRAVEFAVRCGLWSTRLSRALDRAVLRQEGSQ